MTKELLIEILKYNGNLYTVIDAFIQMNYGNNYSCIIQELYETTMSYKKPDESKGLLRFSYSISIFTLYTTYNIFTILQSIDILTEEDLGKDYHKKWHSNMDYNAFIRLMKDLYQFNKVFMPLSEIVGILVCFKSKLFTSIAFEELYIEKVASFIYSEICNGNVNPEFMNYLHTFVT
jgi:hypothetical protein